jgi:hypothetical protein
MLSLLALARTDAEEQPGKSKNDLEELNAVPFSRVVGIERCVLHPNPVASRRPRIEHLKRVAALTKGFRKRALNLWPLGNRWWRLHRAHRFLPTDRCSEFLRGSSRHQGGQDCDHQCLHVSLSFEPCEMLPKTAAAHNISFDGFS